MFWKFPWFLVPPHTEQSPGCRVTSPPTVERNSVRWKDPKVIKVNPLISPTKEMRKPRATESSSAAGGMTPRPEWNLLSQHIFHRHWMFQMHCVFSLTFEHKAHLVSWLFQIIHSKLIYSPIPPGKSFHSIDKGDLLTQKEEPDSKMKLFFRQLFPCLLTSFSDRSSLFWVIITLSPLELRKSFVA